MKKLLVCGGGVLGSQIAFQSAFHDYEVVNWLRSEGSIERAKKKYALVEKMYSDTLEAMKNDPLAHANGLAEKGVSLEEIEKMQDKVSHLMEKIVLTTDLKEAAKDADIIIEAIAENPEEKKAFYSKLNEVIEDKTILCTNSSTFLPSQFADDIKKPERFLALHFANTIWKNNTAEIMGHPGTDPEVFQQVVQFAEDIRMVPLPLKKEQHGYILNSLLIPFLNAGQALWANDIAEPETIDKTWMIATGAPVGPFRILDVVGLTTAYNILQLNPNTKTPGTVEYKIATKLKEYMDQGKLGLSAGEGFYKYK